MREAETKVKWHQMIEFYKNMLNCALDAMKTLQIVVEICQVKAKLFSILVFNATLQIDVVEHWQASFAHLVWFFCDFIIVYCRIRFWWIIFHII